MFLNIIAAKLARRKRLSDIEYLSALANGEITGSSLQFATGSRTTAGVLASITPASGKDLYVAGSKVEIEKSGATGIVVTTQLRNNTSVRETWKGRTETGKDTMVDNVIGIVKGDKLIGDGIKVYDLNVASLVGSATVVGSLFAFIIDTGVSPKL